MRTMDRGARRRRAWHEQAEMRFSYFHLMPWTDLTEAPAQWPASNAAFVPERGKELYDNYIATMAFAEQCGFDCKVRPDCATTAAAGFPPILRRGCARFMRIPNARRRTRAARTSSPPRCGCATSIWT